MSDFRQPAARPSPLRDMLQTRRPTGVHGAGRPPAPGAPLPEPAPLRAAPPEPAADPSLRSGVSRDAEALRYRLYDRLVQELDAPKLMAALADRGDARRAVEDAVARLINQEGITLTRPDELALMRELADEIVGYGPIEPLLQDETISEVMVNGPDRVFYERKGLLHRSDRAFRDDDHVMRVIDRIVTPLGRRIDESSPMVDARLPDGSRVNAIIPPLAIHGPSLTIRKFSKRRLTDADLIRLGALTPELAEFLRGCVASKLNIVVSGGTGSGKTTFLNMLSSYIPPRERIVSIEDPAELRLDQENWVSLETRPPNVEGKGQVAQRELVKNALRMRPDRIIVGECRGSEAFDMLQAMNTGHDGSLTTIHANTPRDAISRIENMVMMANLDLPARAIREQIASAINLVVQLSRLSDGSRRITYVTEIVGMEQEIISLQDVFTFERRGVAADGTVLGQLMPSGIRPHFAELLERSGFPLAPELFARAERPGA